MAISGDKEHKEQINNIFENLCNLIKPVNKPTYIHNYHYQIKILGKLLAPPNINNDWIFNPKNLFLFPIEKESIPVKIYFEDNTEV